MKNLLLKAMKTKENFKYSEESLIKIGNQNKDIYHDFSNKNGDKCSIFVQKIHSSNSHSILY